MQPATPSVIIASVQYMYGSPSLGLPRWHWEVVKNLPANGGDGRDMGSIPGLGRSAGEEHNPLQYSCVENPVDREA